MDLIQNVALAAGLAWGSGVRLYAVVLLTGLLGRFGWMTLPPSLTVLQDPLVLAAAGLMFAVEFLADKAPGFDSVWDAVHSFVRIPAGALLAAGTMGHLDPAWIAAAALLGGAVAGSAHLTKAGSRALINTSPEPFSNWAASAGEDVVAPLAVVAAIDYPLVFLALLALFFVIAIWLLPKLFRALRTIFVKLRTVFS
jgi:hypothetical protein